MAGQPESVRILEKGELKMVTVNGKEMSFTEYVSYIHQLSWEEFVTESVRITGSGYTLELYKRAVEAKAKDIVELGTQVGHSTRALLKAAIENGGHLHSVELNPNTLSLVGESMKSGGADTSFWTAIPGDDLEVVKQWTIYMDFLFIDTSHTYENTLKELEAYSKFVVPRGVIVMHDTHIDRSVPEQYPVRRAVEDWMKNNEEWEFQDITTPRDGWGLGLLRRKQALKG